MRQFIPFSDDWFERDAPLPGPLVPYRCGMSCAHEAGRRPDQRTVPTAPSIDKVSPTRAPIFTAVPAASSST